MIRIPQDPGGAGRFQAPYLASKLRGYNVTTEREEGSKPYRANPFAAQCEHGFVKLVAGAWNDAFIEELAPFPTARTTIRLTPQQPLSAPSSAGPNGTSDSALSGAATNPATTSHHIHSQATSLRSDRLD